MPRPLIGISTRRLPATALGAVPPGVADAPIEGVFSDYAESVAAAGGIPVLLPRSADVGGLVDRLDGIVLAGGEDVEPHRYGAAPVPQSTVHDAGRDEFEMALVRGAIDQGLPILAICRGVQLLNVTLGGTLVPHLDPGDGIDHAMTELHRSERRHVVAVAPDSMLAEAVGSDLDDGCVVAVNSYHHQAVDEPGAGLAIVARAEDGTVEAVEDDQRRILGVQWHPEMHSGLDPVFTWFVEQARSGPYSPRRLMPSGA